MSHRNNARGFNRGNSKGNNKIYAVQKIDKNTGRLDIMSGYSVNPYSCPNKKLNPYRTIIIEENTRKEILRNRTNFRRDVPIDFFPDFLETNERVEREQYIEANYEDYLIPFDSEKKSNDISFNLPEIIGEYIDKEDLISKIIEKNRDDPIEFINDKIARELSTFYTDEDCPICSESCFGKSGSMKITSCCRNFICNPCNVSWKEKNISCPFCRFSPVKLYTIIPMRRYKGVISNEKENNKNNENNKKENNITEIIEIKEMRDKDTPGKNGKLIPFYKKLGNCIGTPIKNCINSIVNFFRKLFG
jgi:hypothetical protein